MSRFVNVIPDNYKALPFCLHSMDIDYPQESIVRVEGMPDLCQILIVTSGTGIFKCNGKSYPLKKGSAFFTDKKVPNEYINTGGLVSTYVAVYSECMEAILKHYGCEDFCYYENIDIDKFIFKITMIHNECLSKKREGIISSMLYELFISFFEYNKIKNYSSLDQTVLYIEKNYNQKLTLKKLSAVHGTSVSKLCHDFKKEYRCTIFEYILDLRLNSARALIRNVPNLTVKNVAVETGFEDSSYFCKAYKQKFNVSPGLDKISPC